MIWLVICGTVQVATGAVFLTLVVARPDTAADVQVPFAVLVLIFALFNQADVIRDWRRARR